jgi:hypothetical protein
MSSHMPVMTVSGIRVDAQLVLTPVHTLHKRTSLDKKFMSRSAWTTSLPGSPSVKLFSRLKMH